VEHVLAVRLQLLAGQVHVGNVVRHHLRQRTKNKSYRFPVQTMYEGVYVCMYVCMYIGMYVQSAFRRKAS
jgi:hypothetical protein